MSKPIDEMSKSELQELCKKHGLATSYNMTKLRAMYLDKMKGIGPPKRGPKRKFSEMCKGKTCAKSAKSGDFDEYQREQRVRLIMSGETDADKINKMINEAWKKLKGSSLKTSEFKTSEWLDPATLKKKGLQLDGVETDENKEIVYIYKKVSPSSPKTTTVSKLKTVTKKATKKATADEDDDDDDEDDDDDDASEDTVESINAKVIERLVKRTGSGYKQWLKDGVSMFYGSCTTNEKKGLATLIAKALHKKKHKDNEEDLFDEMNDDAANVLLTTKAAKTSGWVEKGCAFFDPKHTGTTFKHLVDILVEQLHDDTDDEESDEDDE